MLHDDQIKTEIGWRLRQERERLKLTQAQLAEAMGVGRFAVLNYEGGASVPNSVHLNLLAGRGLDIHYVVTGKRMSLLPESRPAFARIYMALEKTVASLNLKVDSAEILKATWMLLDIGGSEDQLIQSIQCNPATYAAMLDKTIA